MITALVIFFILALILFAINMQSGKHWNGIRSGLRQMVIALPVILLALILAGLLEVMIPEEFITRWLAQEAGFTGIIMGTFGGMIMAIGPYASFPIIATIYNSGAGLGTTISLIAGWAFLGLAKVPFESGFLGWRFSLLRMGLAFPLCLCAGAIAHLIGLLFF